MKPYFERGGITIYHGDCREVLPGLKADAFDLLLTDPPYGIDYGRSGGFSVANGWGPWREAVVWDAERPSREAFDALLRFECEKIIWGGNYFTDYLPPRMCWLIWNKMQRDFSLADEDMSWTSANKATRIFDFSRASALRDVKQHPTQKPEALMKWCLQMFPGVETVLDPFLGSGTTLRAAKDLEIGGIGIEREEKYCEIAARRLEQEVFDFGDAR